MRQVINVPQSVIDEHALVAQTYAGFLVGHPVRAERYTYPITQPGAVTVDYNHPWVEPNPVQDDCMFCQRLNDAEAERRVFGFQAAIDKEVLARKWEHLSNWCREADEDEIPNVFFMAPRATQASDGRTIMVPQRDVSKMSGDFENRRCFIELRQHEPRVTRFGEPRPDGWRLKSAPIVRLPLRLKRKMCIDWNHVYARWMAEKGLSYDFEKREFFKDVQSLEDFHTVSDLPNPPYYTGV